jgi:predicted transposase YbfD/YdcC
MDRVGALGEAVVFLDHFKDLPDPRQHGKVSYPLDEVLLLSLLAVLAGADGFVDIAKFGRSKLAFLRRFRAFANGTPSHDQLGDIFAVLDPERFQQSFVAWVAGLTGAPAEVIAIDGKTSRRSYSRKGQSAALHTLSAFAARQRLVLGQMKVDAKSNEIVAIPELLDMMALEGAVVTIDAMGCQKAIAAKILDKQADYVLALKDNQGTLRADVEEFATEQMARGFQDATTTHAREVDGEHGRIDGRTITVLHDLDWLRQRHRWPGLTAIVIVESSRETAAKTETETRFYITSLNLPADQMARIVRDHWGIENSLHWIMDMVFRDDDCRIRTNHAPANFVILRHIAHNLIRNAPGKDSFRLRRKAAAWDDDFLASLLAA